MPDDRAAALDFRAKVYGPDSFLTSDRYLTWMFEREPGIDGGPSPLWLYRTEGSVRGQQGGVRTTLRVDSDEYPALWATDLYVDPDYQLVGIGAILTQVVTSSVPVTLGIEVSDAARRAFVRAGWIDVGHVPLYVRPIEAAPLIKSRGARVPRLVARALGVGVRIADALASLIMRAARVELQKTNRFDARSDAIWRDSSREYRVIGRRDASWLNWRFSEFPVKDFYHCYYVHHRGRTIGHVVVRHFDNRGVKSALLVDFLCPPRWAVPLLFACVIEVRKAGAEALYCLKERGRLAKAFAAAGFLRRDSGWPMMVAATDVPDSVRAVLSDQSAWFLTAADSNIDHPREQTVFG